MNQSCEFHPHMLEPCRACAVGGDNPFKIAPVEVRKHNHYFKPVKNLEHVDVYRVLHLFNVTDPCIQHALKKLLVCGGRGAGKDISRDVQEAIDSLVRWQEMRAEEANQPKEKQQ